MIAAGTGSPNIDGVSFIHLPMKEETFARLALRSFQHGCLPTSLAYWLDDRTRSMWSKLQDLEIELIVANDIETLGIACALKKKCHAKIIFDAHEFFPERFDNNWRFKFFQKRYNCNLLKGYLSQVDQMITVNESLASRYGQMFGLDVKVMPNLPFYQEFKPTPTLASRIKMLHHGVCIPARHLERLVDLVAILDERFDLTFILKTEGEISRSYLENLKSYAQVVAAGRVHFQHSVPMLSVVSSAVEFDVALILLPPDSFSYRNSLPNKLFEAIQARLAIATWPSPEIKKVVEEYDCGIVAEDFSIDSMAQALSNLQGDRLFEFKINADRAARSLSADRNRDMLLRLSLLW